MARFKKLISFTPICGNRFRCNQTGIVTKHPKEYRHTHMVTIQNKIPLRGRRIAVAVKKQETKPASILDTNHSLSGIKDWDCLKHFFM